MVRFTFLIISLFFSCISLSEDAASNTLQQKSATPDKEANKALSSTETAPKAAAAPKKPAPANTQPAAPASPEKKPEPATPSAKPEANQQAVPTTAVDVAKLTDAIQRQYNTLRSSTFEFEQSYKHPFMNVTETSKGNVAYQKLGGKMVWSYLEPKERQKKFFIIGNKFTYYSASDKIAYTHDCYDRDTLSASVAFLLGSGNLKTSFSISLMDGEQFNKALTWLTLVPKEKDAPVKRIFLGVNKEAKVMESVVEDPTGGKNHFKFINFKTNPKIAASVFVFVPPAGVTVQPMPNVQCPPKQPPAKTPPPPPTPKPKKPVEQKPKA